ncbi:tRNA glutamyl-Q(34) synthetase GluQRS [Microbaculum marinum]|uniref:tRNA glutamyl-Q(34) synthetase GluQRS n=1 Tax=Microbaculum marinum TaxID=1764581 RepID=A0AAW9RMV9_9HYPH
MPAPAPPVVLRFAPSPTGRLHLGHALSALLAHEAARRLGGRFLLRIEDIDPTRCRPEFEAAICDDLAWLGIGWEEPVRRQSEHVDAYLRAAARLADAGLLYPCTCSRRRIADAVAAREAAGALWPRDPDGSPLYPGTCRPAGPLRLDVRQLARAGVALRLDMAAAVARAGGGLQWCEYGDTFYTPAFDPASRGQAVRADPSGWGDVVLCRKETPTSYHLSVTVDDALQAITHVTRGRDLYEATAIHRLLQRLLDLPEPRYAHHRLLRGAEGRKLSKSAGDTGLRALRDAGATPRDVRRMAGL